MDEKAEAPKAERRLVRTSPLAIAPLRAGFSLATHVLGHSRLVCDERVLEILAWHARPRRPADVAAHFGESERGVSFVLGHLVQAQLVTPEGFGARGRIRDAFARRRVALPPVAPSAPLPERAIERWGAERDPLATESETSALALTPRSRLVLSPHVVALGVAPGETLALHPLFPRTHLRDRVWRLARAFRAPTTVAAAAAALGLERLDEVVAACRFLVLRGLLWPGRATERRAFEAFAARFDVRPDGPSVRQWTEPHHQWTDVATPYDWADVRHLRAYGRVALVGQCQINFAGAALQRVAQRNGVHLGLFGEPTPSPALARSAWAAVFLSLADAAVGVHEATARGDWEAARRAIPHVVAQMDARIVEARRHTEAPIAVVSVAAPSLSGVPESSAERHLRAEVYAELDRRLSRALADLAGGDAFLIDESTRVGAGTAPGDVVLDDEYAGSAHHCAYNPSFWIPLTQWPSSASAREEDVPALPAGDPQAGAASALAPVLFDFLRRRHARTPVRVVVFDPDALLWPGRVAEKASAHDSLQRAMGRPDYQFYGGTNEALLAVRARGVTLVCAAALEESALRARWNVPASSTSFVSAEHVDRFVRSARELAALLAALGVEAEDCLWLGSTASAVPALPGMRVHAGDRWSLKRYLLTAPELTPARRVGAQRDEEEVARPEAAPPPPARATTDGAGEDATLEAAVDAAIEQLLRAPPPEARRVDDLRRLGLDSLTALDLAREIERRVGAAFADEDLTVATIYRRSTLLEAARRAARAKAVGPVGHASSRRAARAAQPLESCARIVDLLLQNAEASRHPWQLKMVRSTRANDYEYATWTTLLERASGYADLFARAGARPGDVVTLMLPQGIALVAAYLGALLHDFVPSIVAAPSEKLSTSAFAGWFREVAERSATRLVLCDETHEALVGACLAGSGIGVSSRAPSPGARTTAPAGRAAGRPLLLQHSSGTTGLKKGVLLGEEATLAQVRSLARALRCDARDVVVSWAPLYHDMGLVACLLLPLLADLPLVLMSPFDWLKRPDLLLREVTRERGTLSWMPNFAFQYSAERIPDAAIEGLDLSSWRAVVNCSEPVTERAAAAFHRKLAPVGLRRSAVSASYAMAETTFAVTQVPPGRGVVSTAVDPTLWRRDGVARRAPEPGDAVFLTGSGEVIDGVEVAIVDADGAPLPEGHAGEIRVRSDGMMRGYFADADATRAALRDGWYSTGDIGLRLGRELYVTGRKKDLVIVAGNNVYPHDVEESVGALPGLKPGRVVAFGVRDESLGTERLVLLAETEGTSETGESDAARAALVERVRAHVSSVFGVTPHDVRLVGARTLLKSTSGKLSRAQNRARYLAPDGLAPDGLAANALATAGAHQASIETEPPHGT